VLTERRDARWSPSPPASLVRSTRTLTLMLGSKPGMLSLSLTFHCVYVAHGSRAAPQNFNPPAPITPSFMLLAAARAMGRLRIVRNLPNIGSLIRLRVVWRLFLANTSSDSGGFRYEAGTGHRWPLAAASPRPRSSSQREVESSSGYIRLPEHAETIAPVTILDGQGHVVRVVLGTESRRPELARAAPQTSQTGCWTYQA